MMVKVLGVPVPASLMEGHGETAQEFIAAFHAQHKGWKRTVAPDGSPLQEEAKEEPTDPLQ